MGIAVGANEDVALRPLKWKLKDDKIDKMIITIRKELAQD